MSDENTTVEASPSGSSSDTSTELNEDSDGGNTPCSEYRGYSWKSASSLTDRSPCMKSTLSLGGKS